MRMKNRLQNLYSRVILSLTILFVIGYSQTSIPMTLKSPSTIESSKIDILFRYHKSLQLNSKS
jgi:hypothetical protein